MATVTIEIPDDSLLGLGKTPEERNRFILEAIAVDCYQAKQWSTGTCGRLLGIPRMQFDELLMQRGIPYNITGRDVVDGFNAIDKVIPK